MGQGRRCREGPGAVMAPFEVTSSYSPPSAAPRAREKGAALCTGGCP